MKHLVGGEVGAIRSLTPARCLQPSVNMFIPSPEQRKAQRKGKKMALIKHPLCAGALHTLTSFRFNGLTREQLLSVYDNENRSLGRQRS